MYTKHYKCGHTFDNGKNGKDYNLFYNYNHLFSFRARIHVSYDNEFLTNVASGSHSEAEKKINAILNAGKEIFKWKSLTTKIELDIIGIKHVDKTLKLHGSTISQVL